MSDTNSSYTPSPVQDKRTDPPGILPKNIQSWVLTGIALVMIIIIAFSGKSAPKTQRPSSQPSPIVDPNAERIQEYQKRIEEQTRKLQIEQAALARTQAALGPAAGVTGSASSDPPPAPYRLVASPAYAPAEHTPQRDSIRMDKEKREYESLFASNLALTYRSGLVAKPAAVQPSPSPLSEESLAKLLPFYLYANQAVSQAGAAQLGTVQTGPVQSAPAPTTPAAAAQRNPVAIATSAGKEYRLFEGSVLETVLTNRLDGSFSGPINCMVTTNVYSHDGQHLLIPQGTRALGEARKVETFGQQRLAVFFHRLIMPDGYSVSLDQFQGLNQIGETGLRDQINHHYLQVFGVSVAIGAIAGVGQANTRSGVDQAGVDAYEQGVATSLSQSSLRILDRYLNVLPTFTIREGHRVKVYLSADLLLPAYEKHGLPSDL